MKPEYSYYESHITIEPIFDEDLAKVREIANKYGFILAELLMQKRKEDSAERSKYDTFLTSRAKDYQVILDNTLKK